MLSYTDSGSGLPVILIHGFPLCRRMWLPQVEALSSAGCRVVCPDLPGFGDSPPLAGEPSMARYADAIVDLMVQLKIAKAVVGGMSMGGYVLLNLAERYPERLLGTVYMVTRAAADDAAGKGKRTMLANEVAGGNRTIVPDAFAGVLFAPETREKKPGLVYEVREWMDSTSAVGLIGGLHAMRDRDDYLEKLADLEHPALVIGAEQDIAVPPEHARALAHGLPNATLELIQDAGHMVNLEQPERFNRVVLAFLKDMEAKIN